MEERADDDDFTPVRPWQQGDRTVHAPPSASTSPWMDCASAKAPVAGRAAGRCYIATGEVLFFGGRQMSGRPRNEVTFHRDHTDEVMSIAVHPTRSLVATGQQGRCLVMARDYEGAP